MACESQAWIFTWGNTGGNSTSCSLHFIIKNLVLLNGLLNASAGPAGRGKATKTQPPAAAGGRAMAKRPSPPAPQSGSFADGLRPHVRDGSCGFGGYTIQLRYNHDTITVQSTIQSTIQSQSMTLSRISKERKAYIFLLFVIPPVSIL